VARYNKSLRNLFKGALCLGAIFAIQMPKYAFSMETSQNSMANYVQIPQDDLVVIDTSKGRIIVALASKYAPNHAKRFKELTRENFYDGIYFHRVIDGFMAQTGDPTGTGTGDSSKPDLKAEFEFKRDANTPFNLVSLNSGTISGFVEYLPVTTQPDELMLLSGSGKVKAWINHCPAVLSMARSGDPNSANSQFFMMREKSTSLDRKYSAFGYVVSGLDVVRAIKIVDPEKTPPKAPSTDKMLKVRMMADLPKNERKDVFYLAPNSEEFLTNSQMIQQQKGALFNICDIAPKFKILP
jgi:peptidylprolyl isomerase